MSLKMPLINFWSGPLKTLQCPWQWWLSKLSTTVDNIMTSSTDSLISTWRMTSTWWLPTCSMHCQLDVREETDQEQYFQNYLSFVLNHHPEENSLDHELFEKKMMGTVWNSCHCTACTSSWHGGASKPCHGESGGCGWRNCWMRLAPALYWLYHLFLLDIFIYLLY